MKGIEKNTPTIENLRKKQKTSKKYQKNKLFSLKQQKHATFLWKDTRIHERVKPNAVCSEKNNKTTIFINRAALENKQKKQQDHKPWRSRVCWAAAVFLAARRCPCNPCAIVDKAHADLRLWRRTRAHA